MTTEFILRYTSGPYNDGQMRLTTLKEAKDIANLSGFEQWAIAEVVDGQIVAIHPKPVVNGNYS